MARHTSCGVIVTDGRQLLLGHATGSPRWDIPKGMVEPNEDLRAAAERELQEETGLTAPPGALRELGRYPYLPAKDLALFVWQPDTMPDPEALVCRSSFTLRDGTLRPEFDRFGLFDWPDAMRHVGKNLARVLQEIYPAMLAQAPRAGDSG